jgi:Carboxypeptidase regulatory-like domain
LKVYDHMRIRPRLGLPLALASIAVLLLAVGPLLAQVDVTTGRISGQIVDETVAPLPGATVEAKSRDTGLALVAVSDFRGIYRIVSVPVGTSRTSSFSRRTRSARRSAATSRSAASAASTRA